MHGRNQGWRSVRVAETVAVGAGPPFVAKTAELEPAEPIVDDVFRAEVADSGIVEGARALPVDLPGDAIPLVVGEALEDLPRRFFPDGRHYDPDAPAGWRMQGGLGCAQGHKVLSGTNESDCT